MRKVVGERSFGNIDRQLIFDDWTWESLEEARDGESSYSETLTPAEAVAFFEEHFSGDLPIELAYQTDHPKPVTALFGNKVWQFDHKDWSLYGLASEYEDPMGETGYAYETWLFGAKDKFLTIAFGYHVGADVALDTQVELLTKDGAADFLKLNGYSLPEELSGFGKVATLSPDTIERIDTLDNVPVQDEHAEDSAWLSNYFDTDRPKKREFCEAVETSETDSYVSANQSGAEAIYLVDRKEIGEAFNSKGRQTVQTWVSAVWFPDKHSQVPERWRSDEVTKAMTTRPTGKNKQVKPWSEVCNASSIFVYSRQRSSDSV